MNLCRIQRSTDMKNEATSVVSLAIRAIFIIYILNYLNLFIKYNLVDLTHTFALSVKMYNDCIKSIEIDRKSRIPFASLEECIYSCIGFSPLAFGIYISIW